MRIKNDLTYDVSHFSPLPLIQNSPRLELMGLIAHALDRLYKTGRSAVKCLSIQNILFRATMPEGGRVYVYKYFLNKKGNLRPFLQDRLVSLGQIWADTGS